MCQKGYPRGRQQKTRFSKNCTGATAGARILRVGSRNKTKNIKKKDRRREGKKKTPVEKIPSIFALFWEAPGTPGRKSAFFAYPEKGPKSFFSNFTVFAKTHWHCRKTILLGSGGAPERPRGPKNALRKNVAFAREAQKSLLFRSYF